MVRVFLGLLMLIAISGAVSGAYVFMRNRDAREFSAENVNSSYVDLDTIALSIVKDNEILETREYKLVLEVRDGGPRRLVLKQTPALRDRFMVYMSALSTRRGPENLDNIDYLKQQLRYASNDLLGADVVRSVMIKSFIANSPS